MTEPVTAGRRRRPDDPAVDAVVFDLGNVLVRWEPERAWADLDPATVAAFHEEVDFMAWNHTLDAGVATAEAVAHVASTAPRHEPVVATYVERFLDTLAGGVEGTRAVVEELAASDVRLVALTNWSAELFERARPVLEDVAALSAFEGVVVSGVERLAKPDPAVFRLLLDRYGLQAARTAFVDDSPRNVQAASALGIRAIHFTGASQLRAELAALGLPVRAGS